MYVFGVIPVLASRMELTGRSALIYAPCIYYMSEWFVERRGLANGVIDAGQYRFCDFVVFAGSSWFRDRRRWPRSTSHPPITAAEVWQFYDSSWIGPR